MCHLCQNSRIDLEKYGLLKFSLNSKPITFAVPIAISEYPEKSQ